MSEAIRVDVVIITRRCPVCGVHYGMDEALYARRRQDGGDWYCTNGHSLHVIEPEVEKLRKQLERERENAAWYSQRYDQLHAENRELGHQVRVQKAAKTRLLRRVTNGVCPCCQRSFANLKGHMQTKHPDQIVTAEATS